MQQERFTEQAQEALALSQQLVRNYQHSQWDVEHILLALLQQEHGLTGEILSKLGVNADEVRRRVEEALDKTPKISHEGAMLYATPRTVRLL
ncbi:MAG: ATP-dependent Clp protease ATP-binding subunit, partial [Dehalococcoidia bacterium]|nr:ATP-dependent Clp protease ATP-binding subunit [Dehalococcoidia bacterium]